MFPKINQFLSSVDFETITADRKNALQPLIDYIESKTKNGQTIRLNFICTHNSRRSHLSQIWAQVASEYYQIKNVNCYSGGTEATAMYPMVAETLTNIGFEVNKISQESNPVYAIKYGDNEQPIIGFSKTYDHSFNPKSEFAAVMTCTQADEGCPFIIGAEKRISLPFEDPKAFDNTDLKAEKYLERSIQIATEMAFVFSNISK